ncbi:class I SAM-dependent methyltransferase [Natronosalvus vescus]|uniref:class I SAM-dependent methyltransferase n=1 Tax=Natronosalvus vescus TaxID=2953881 RepID=UPI00209179AE|nr:class I SAM-dependent methyltransferase [Natronosalvus vescus]
MASFIEDSGPVDAFGQDLETVAMAFEQEPTRDAVGSAIGGQSISSELRSELFDVTRESWRVLTSRHIGGQCLELGAGLGRRSMLLAEQADTVHAVDPSLTKLRILEARTDYDSASRVQSVHATLDRLPFPDGTFDTIVADTTGSSGPAPVDRLERFRNLLDDDGNLLFFADGWSRRLGFSQLLGLESDDRRDGGVTGIESSIRVGTPARYASLAREAGFDSVSVYALFPSASNPLFVFDVGHDDAIRTMIDLLEGETTDGLKSLLMRLGLSTAVSSGVFERALPSYLIACSTGDPPASDPFAFEQPLVISGRARSVVLDTPDGSVRRAWKVPNRKGHAPLTEREHSVLSMLNGSDQRIGQTIPKGERRRTPFGLARVEEPVSGTRLADSFDGSVDSFEYVLRQGFEWLINFQRTYGSDPVVWSPEFVRDQLRFEPAGVYPPAVEEPVSLFTTPVHGDFIAQNILEADGRVSGVIDWEYSAPEANPIIDAGFLVLNTLTFLGGDPRAAYRTLVCDPDDEYARVARRWIERYCDAVDVPVRTFSLFLPAAYLHRLELDWRFDAVSTYTDKMAARAELVEYFHQRWSERESTGLTAPPVGDDQRKWLPTSKPDTDPDEYGGSIVND